VTLDKTTKPAGEQTYDTHTDTNVGDLIDYKIVTTVPAYLEAYTNPHFTLTDALSTGLTFDTGVEGAKTAAALTVKVGDAVLDSSNYTVEFTDDQHYTLNFTKAYLQSRTTATVVTITYQAKITADAYNVNPEDNTATIDYSNNPSDTNGHDTKTDKTKHYTFDIDASLIGDSEYTTSELIKVGGKFVNGVFVPDVEEHTYSNKTDHNPLANAEFKLYTDAECKTVYTNSNYNADTVFKTDAYGLLNIKGLDAGTYYLKETKAPAGYVTIKDAAKFEIVPTYAAEDTTDDDGATYKPLISYQVKVNDNEVVSTYTFDNGTKKITKKTDGTAGDNSHELQNVRGTELPSTGGMGTTLLYVGGSILVILAAVLLITKRRMSSEE
jgi:fimbrial isopeptide formation D2 family protein/LPXTG-motif cell wall-anchored protein